MHPINEIRGSISKTLAGKRIVLGITGSIAAVECVKLARELARHGAEIIPVMSKAATKIVHPDAIHFATGLEPIIELDGAVKHVELCGDTSSQADLLLIAPATANTISKISQGIDDTSITTMASCALGSSMSIMIVPAMHNSMYTHDIITENIARLKKAGVTFIGPKMEEKKAKMAAQEDIVNAICHVAGPKDLEKTKILVITGSSQEPIDDIRYITNFSTGRTGVLLAQEAYRRGADVELWGGKNMELPGYVKLKEFGSVSDLDKMASSARADIIIVPAAISDFTLKSRKGKISSSKAMKIKLEPAQKILGTLRKHKNTKLIGFKAETGISSKELETRALKRMREHGLDMIVANLLEDVKPETTKTLIITPKKIIKFKGQKIELANTIYDIIGGKA